MYQLSELANKTQRPSDSQLHYHQLL